MKHIDLRHIDINFLFDSVASSGLASIEQLTEAYKEHALAYKERAAAYKEHALRAGPEPDEDYPKKKPRLTIPVWKSSKAHMVSRYSDGEFLDVDPIESGIVRWIIEVRCTERVKFFCGIENGRKVFGLNEHVGGTACDGILGVDFGNGCQITMTLNLLANEKGNGTLSFSIDDGDTTLIASNMREELKYGGGFTPFAWIHNIEGWFKIVDYEVVAT